MVVINIEFLKINNKSVAVLVYKICMFKRLLLGGKISAIAGLHALCTDGHLGAT